LKSVNTKIALLAIIILPLYMLAGCGGPDRAPATYLEAEELLGRGKFLLAIDKYESVAREFESTPFAPKSLYKKALIYNRFLRDKKRAVEAYYQVLSLYPDTSDAYTARLDLAGIYSSSGNHTKAVEQYQWIVDSRREPEKEEDYRYTIALEYFKMNDFEQAQAELKELLSMAVKKNIIAEAELLRGDTFYITGHIPEALAVFEDIVSKFAGRPVAIRASFNRAKALEDVGREDEALAVLKGLQDKYPNKDVLRRTINGIKTRMREQKQKRRKKSRH